MIFDSVICFIHHYIIWNDIDYIASLIIIPVLVLLHFWTSSGFSNNNLINLKNRNSCFWSQANCPLFGLFVVVNIQSRYFLGLSSKDIQSFGNITTVSSDHLSQKFIWVDTTVLSQNPGENFKSFGVSTKTVLIKSSQFFTLVF